MIKIHIKFGNINIILNHTQDGSRKNENYCKKKKKKNLKISRINEIVLLTTIMMTTGR